MAARARRASGLTHLVFLVCDHFEPLHGASGDEQVESRLQTWLSEYAELQRDCRSRYGHAPSHTWFYPPHHGIANLKKIARMVYAGLGEAELHYHHSGDTAESLKSHLVETLREYAKFGLLLESGPGAKTSFGFVHGDWALDNSCGGRFCGVNGELSILQELGCWGDFTMPSANQCQTRKINSIYYAIDSPLRSKSHNRGRDARVGESNPPGFFLMQGPLGINWKGPRYPRIENASLTSPNWGNLQRIRTWVNCNVHVHGRPDWLFIKLHTHGAIERDFDAIFGGKAREMHRILNEQFNDGKRFRLHYVTAREAYNIARAAEDGHSGDPSEWRDYKVPRPALAYYASDAPHKLGMASPDELQLSEIESDSSTEVRIGVGPVSLLRGAVTRIQVDVAHSTVAWSTKDAGQKIALTLRDGARIVRDGAAPLAIDAAPHDPREIVLKADGRDVALSFQRLPSSSP